jgi:hypothetical protein
MHEAHKYDSIMNLVDISGLEDPKPHSVMLYAHYLRFRIPYLVLTLFARMLQNKPKVWRDIGSYEGKSENKVSYFIATK